jgi:DNA repair protein RecO (recombination protein O)
MGTTPPGRIRDSIIGYLGAISCDASLDEIHDAVRADLGSVATAGRIFRGTVKGLAEEEWPRARAAELRRFAIEVLERHLEVRLMTTRVLGRG